MIRTILYWVSGSQAAGWDLDYSQSDGDGHCRQTWRPQFLLLPVCEGRPAPPGLAVLFVVLFFRIGLHSLFLFCSASAFLPGLLWDSTGVCRGEASQLWRAQGAPDSIRPQVQRGRVPDRRPLPTGETLWLHRFPVYYYFWKWPRLLVSVTQPANRHHSPIIKLFTKSAKLEFTAARHGQQNKCLLKLPDQIKTDRFASLTNCGKMLYCYFFAPLVLYVLEIAPFSCPVQTFVSFIRVHLKTDLIVFLL